MAQPQPPSRLAEVRARLSLPLTRRATGLLDGVHHSLFKGHGIDFDDFHLYTPGEDVNDIDWKSSARMGQPVVRRYIRDSNINVVIGVDTGVNMTTVAPSGETKGEIASFVVSLVSYLARDRGDRVALVAGNSQTITHMPGRAGTEHLESLIRVVESQFAASASLASSGNPPTSDLNRLVRTMTTLFSRRALVILVTDAARPAAEHHRLIAQLRVKHKVLVVSVADALPVIGQEPTRDVAGMRSRPRFTLNRDDLVAAAERHVLERRAEITARLRKLEIDHAIVDSSDNVIRVFLRLLGRSRRVTR